MRPETGAHGNPRKGSAHAMDQIVAQPRPAQADLLVADMVSHPGGARREDREIGPARALQLELRALETFPDLVVGDVEPLVRCRHLRGVLDAGDLALAILVQASRLGRVVPVAIDDHDTVAEDRGRKPGNEAGRPARDAGRMLRTGLHRCQTRPRSSSSAMTAA